MIAAATLCSGVASPEQTGIMAYDWVAACDTDDFSAALFAERLPRVEFHHRDMREIAGERVAASLEARRPRWRADTVAAAGELPRRMAGRELIRRPSGRYGLPGERYVPSRQTLLCARALGLIRPSRRGLFDDWPDRFVAAADSPAPEPYAEEIAS